MGRVTRLAIAAMAAQMALCAVPTESLAIEGGASFYLLGGKLPLSGIVPGPGMYFQNDVYIYNGSIGGNIELPIGGQIIADVEATLVFEAPTVLGITPWEVLGGRLGFGATVPIVGFADISATVGPLAVEDDVFTIGDPVAAALLGWDAGNFHWSIGGTLNIPIGDYQEGQIANVALHRWAGDITGAVTWLNPGGFELSGAAGFTINGTNHATDYNSGNEFHLEGVAMKYFDKHVNIGFAGYYNKQISPDSGSRLGAFEGEVMALGGIMGFNFEAGHLPVSTRVKYFHELDATNRLQGDAVYLTVSMPLWVPTPPVAAAE